MTYPRACLACGVDEAAIDRAVKKDHIFKAKIQCINAEVEAELAQIVIDDAHGRKIRTDSDGVERKLNWKSALAFLSRRLPDEYAPRHPNAVVVREVDAYMAQVGDLINRTVPPEALGALQEGLAELRRKLAEKERS